MITLKPLVFNLGYRIFCVTVAPKGDMGRCSPVAIGFFVVARPLQKIMIGS